MTYNSCYASALCNPYSATNAPPRLGAYTKPVDSPSHHLGAPIYSDILDTACPDHRLFESVQDVPVVRENEDFPASHLVGKDVCHVPAGTIAKYKKRFHVSHLIPSVVGAMLFPTGN